MRNLFNLYVILAPSEVPILKRNISYLKKNIPAQSIYIVTSKNAANDIPNDVNFIDEDSVFTGLTLSNVKEYLKSLNADEKNAGWYLQQFLKMSVCFCDKNEFYLVWDADTIPLRHIDFFDDNGKPFFTLKREHVESYFNTIKNLFNFEKTTPESFVSEHMLFNVKIMKNLINDIEGSSNIPGDTFWKKILQACNLLEGDQKKQTKQRYFSEFETYGTYVDYKYPDFYEKRRLMTLRLGKSFLGDNPTDEILEWVSHDLDIISFEKWDTTQIEDVIALSKDAEHRRQMGFLDTIKYVFNIYKKQIIKTLPFYDKAALKKYKTLKKKFWADFLFTDKPKYIEEIEEKKVSRSKLLNFSLIRGLRKRINQFRVLFFNKF